jgi:hypothetical protein
VVIDDTAYSDARVPEDMRLLHWQSLPDGAATPDFADDVRDQFRDYERRSKRGG